MNQWTKIFVGVAAALFVVVLILLFMILNFDSGACENQVHQEYLSPGNHYKAVVFERRCGASAKVSTQISLIRAFDSLGVDAGNIFIVDGAVAQVAPKLYWNLADELWIYYPLDGKEFRAEKSWGKMEEIKIRYVREK